MRNVFTLWVPMLFMACGAAEAPPVTSRAAEPPKPAPPPRPEPEARNGLDEKQIRSVVEAEYGAVRGCHTIEFSGKTASAGTIVVDLNIEPSGGVRTAIVSDSTFNHARLEECVVDVTKGLVFPKAAGPTEFSWVFKFREG